MGGILYQSDRIGEWSRPRSEIETYNPGQYFLDAVTEEEILDPAARHCDDTEDEQQERATGGEGDDRPDIFDDTRPVV